MDKIVTHAYIQILARARPKGVGDGTYQRQLLRQHFGADLHVTHTPSAPYPQTHTRTHTDPNAHMPSNGRTCTAFPPTHTNAPCLSTSTHTHTQTPFTFPSPHTHIHTHVRAHTHTNTTSSSHTCITHTRPQPCLHHGATQANAKAALPLLLPKGKELRLLRSIQGLQQEKHSG